MRTGFVNSSSRLYLPGSQEARSRCIIVSVRGLGLRGVESGSAAAASVYTVTSVMCQKCDSSGGGAVTDI